LILGLFNDAFQLDLLYSFKW